MIDLHRPTKTNVANLQKRQFGNMHLNVRKQLYALK